MLPVQRDGVWYGMIPLDDLRRAMRDMPPIAFKCWVWAVQYRRQDGTVARTSYHVVAKALGHSDAAVDRAFHWLHENGWVTGYRDGFVEGRVR